VLWELVDVIVPGSVLHSMLSFLCCSWPSLAGSVSAIQTSEFTDESILCFELCRIVELQGKLDAMSAVSQQTTTGEPPALIHAAARVISAQLNVALTKSSSS